MTTRDRFEKLKDWVQAELCAGRSMKCPAKDGDITQIRYAEPGTYMGYFPSFRDGKGIKRLASENTAPSILIMPDKGYVENEEEKRFDRYQNIHCEQRLGRNVKVCLLFSVWEPGIRMPGFAESGDEKGNGLDMSLMEEGTEQGFYTLCDWMDEAERKLLGTKVIPDSDLTLVDEEMEYGPFMDQNYIVDKRVIYYGMISANFKCMSDRGQNEKVEALL